MTTKQLPRLQACELYKIGSPRWNGDANRREVGLAEFRMKKHNEIVFTYVRKSDGEKSVPGSFYFDGDKRQYIDFERQNRKGLTLVIVPFDELEKLERV